MKTVTTNKAVNSDRDVTLPIIHLTGEIVTLTTTTVPARYLECNGATISRTTYSGLFSKIGTNFGAGDGSTTFKLPDLRGEFIRGFDHGRGIDSGRILGSWQADEFKSHNHATWHTKQLIADYIEMGGNLVAHRPGGGIAWQSNAVLQNLGGNETRPNNVALMHCIKY